MYKLRWFSRRRVLIFSIAFMVFVACAWLGLSRTNLGQAVLRVYLPALAAAPKTPDKTFEPLPEFAFNVQPAPLPWIEPGSNVSDGPPPQWTHLIVKNDMQIVAGAQGSRAKSWNELLSSFSLAVVARVSQPHDGQAYYTLDEVAMGWCRAGDEGSMVISTSTFRDLAVDLSDLEAMLLAMQELECEQNVRVVARSAITMIYDVERFFVFNEQHRRAILREAILVNPRTGKLAAFMWKVAPAEYRADAGGAIELLPRDFVTTFELRLKPAQGGVLALPASDDFAILKLPNGKAQLPLNDGLAKMALASEFTPQSARKLEKSLQQYLDWK